MTARPQTDRERIYWLEARVAELEDEIAEWNRQADHDRRPSDDLQRAIQLGLRRINPKSAGPALACLLAALLDQPGRVVSKHTLYDYNRSTADGCRTLDVQLCTLRSTLAAAGFSRQVIVTFQGTGLMISAGDCKAIRAKLIGSEFSKGIPAPQ